MSDAVFLPQFIRFSFASLFFLLILIIKFKKLPGFSLGLLHASITTAVFSYLISPVLAFISLRTLSSGIGALVFSTLPIWVSLLMYGEFKRNLLFYLLIIGGICGFLFGIYDESSLRGENIGISFLLLIFSMVFYMFGFWISRRLFWIHSNIELNFWSMLLGGLLSLALGLSIGETKFVFEWKISYWFLIALLGILVSGIGSYVYRVTENRLNILLLTLGMPLLALTIGGAVYETPINIYTGVGFLVVVFVLGYLSFFENPKTWLCLSLYNDKREFDRVHCVLPALLRVDSNEIDIHVSDISVSGLGFRANEKLEKDKEINIIVPLGSKANKLEIMGKIAWQKNNPEIKSFGFFGGIEYLKISEDKWQMLAEFLVKLSKAEE